MMAKRWKSIRKDILMTFCLTARPMSKSGLPMALCMLYEKQNASAGICPNLGQHVRSSTDLADLSDSTVECDSQWRSQRVSEVKFPPLA